MLTLDTSSPIATGSDDSRSVAIGDVTNDGIADIVVANALKLNQLFVGDAAGGLTLNTTSPIATGTDDFANSRSVTIGDVTNDSIADVVVANFGRANQLFVGDAAGGLTLNTSSPIATGSAYSFSVTIGDVTNDGIADVVVANYGQANQLFVGDAAGGLTLDTSSPIATGSDNSLSVAIGDVTNDGIADVVVANYGKANQLFVGDAAGGLTLDTSSPIATGSDESASVAIGDVTNDGIADVVVVNYGKASNQLFPIVRQIDLELTLDTTSPIATGRDRSYSLTIGDVTNDSIADVVVANYGQANQLFVGDAAGGLTLNTTSPIATGSDDSQSVAIGDVTNDGIADVVVANALKANQLFVGDAAGGLTLNTSSPIATGSDYSLSVAIGDVTNDSIADIVVANAYGANQHFVGDAAGGLTLDTTSPIATGTDNSQSVAIGDVTNDGIADIVVANYGQANQLFVGDAAGGLTLNTTSPIATGSDNSRSVTIGDVTNDGIADVVVANAYGANQLFVGDAAGGLTLNTTSPIATGSDNSLSVAIGDVTNDGIADVVVTNDVFKANQLFVGDAAGGLTLDTTSPIATGSGDSRSVAIGDVTNDGIADVVVANYDQATQLFVGASCEASFTRTQDSSGGLMCVALTNVLSIVAGAVPMGCPRIGRTCAECPAGRLSNEASTLCPTICAAGKYRRLGEKDCKSCPRGKFGGDSTHRRGCSLCSAGSYGAEVGLLSSECSGSCPSGTECLAGTSSPVVILPGYWYGTTSTGTLERHPCPAGSYCTNGAKAACPAGHYQDKQGSPFCNACPGGRYANKATEASGCLEAPTNLNDGAVCKDGMFTYKPGFWHDGIDLETNTHRDGFQLDAHSSFYACPGGAASCSVDPTSGAVTCQESSTGVLCAVCKKGHTLSSDGSCVACSSQWANWHNWVVIFVGVSMLALAFWLSRSAGKLGVKMREKSRPIQAKLKIMFAFYQVTLLCGPVFHIPYHRVPGYEKLSRALSVLTIDVFSALNFDCFAGYSFHAKLYTMSFFALGLEVGVVAAISNYRKTGKARRIATWSLVITYFLYASLCATIFQTFQCKTVDSTEWLVADYSIHCHGGAHQGAHGFAVFMILAFCLGLPVIYLKLLRDSRPVDPDAATGSALFDSPFLNKVLNAVLPRKKHEKEYDGLMDFFQGGYRKEFFFWEVIECIRKLSLTGFAVFFGPGSMMQLGLAIMLTMAYMVMLASFNPYTHEDGCNNFARIEQAALFLVLLEMAMVKYVVTAEAIPNPAFEPGVDLGLLSVALVVTQLSIAVIGFLDIAKEISGDHGRAYSASASAAESMTSSGVGPTAMANVNPMMEADGDGWEDPDHKVV
jgi:hypothetical protein